LHAAQTLERMLEGRRRVQLTVVDGEDAFVFTPLLPNVANGELTTSSLRLRLSEQLKPTTRLERAWVEGIDMGRRELASDTGPIPFDYLVVAPGAVTDWKGKQAWREHSMTCKTAEDAHAIRAHMRRKLAEAQVLSGEERQRALTFVFAGGGPTGIELAAELWAALSYEVLPSASEEVRRALRFIIVEPDDMVLPGLPPELRVFARRRLDDMGVELRLGRLVVERDAERVVLDDGEEILADSFFWCAGVKPPEWLADTGLQLDGRGRVRVDDTLLAKSADGIYVIGDSARTPTESPQTAQVAAKQGPLAAKNLVADLSGRTPKRWKYFHQGDLLTLGRGHAAVTVFGVATEGAPAYAFYRLVYAGLMPNALRPVKVLAEWLEHDYSSYRRTKDIGLLEDES